MNRENNKLKGQLYKHCEEWVEIRIKTIEDAIAQAQASANSETKSSAGDKYETGRSMMQLEMENYSTQLGEARALKNVLEKIDAESIQMNASLGSIVFTNQGNYFISIAAGPYKIDNESFLIVSPASPIGAKLMSLKKGDIFEFRDKVVSVNEVI